MSVLTLAAPAVPIALPAPSSPPVPKRWTVAEFHQLWEDGWFEGCRPMLLDGEIFQMPIPGNPHDKGVGMANFRVVKAFGDTYWVRVQMPLVLGQMIGPGAGFGSRCWNGGRTRSHSNNRPSRCGSIRQFTCH